MRIVTFNIRSSRGLWPWRPWLRRRRVLVDVVRRLEADVLLLQEVRWRQFRFLSRRLPEFELLGIGRDDGRRKGEMLVSAFRRSSDGASPLATPFWFSGTPLVPSRFPGARAQRMALVVEWNGQLFVNVHLDEQPNPNLGACVELLVQWSEGRAIVAGDFNCRVDDPALDHLKEIGLRDGLGSLPPMGDGCATHHSFTGSGDGTRIDHVFVPPSMRLLTGRISQDSDFVIASDHWPVVVDVETAASTA